MLTQDGARLQVFLELRRRFGWIEGRMELVILDEHTREYAWGWIFYYTTRGWRDGDVHYAVAGNGPVLIDREEGYMQFFGPSQTIEACIDEFMGTMKQRSPQEA